jgi:hypothetical protein
MIVALDFVQERATWMTVKEQAFQACVIRQEDYAALKAPLSHDAPRTSPLSPHHLSSVL